MSRQMSRGIAPLALVITRWLSNNLMYRRLFLEMDALSILVEPTHRAVRPKIQTVCQFEVLM